MNLNLIREPEYENKYYPTCENVIVLQNHGGDSMADNRRQAEKESEDFILGIVVNRLRVEHGLTFEEFEKKSGLPLAFLHNLTTGSGPQKPGRIPMLAKFFGVTTDYLLCGEDKDREELKRQIVELENRKRKEEFEEAKQISMLNFLEEENKRLKTELKKFIGA